MDNNHKNHSNTPSLNNLATTTDKILDVIWPIHKHELPKFIGITALMFCILFNQNLLRALKDSLQITMVGTETINFLKFLGVLPAAMAMTLAYVKLLNKFKPEYIFYIIMSGFLVYFFIFGFIIFPNYEYTHLSRETTQILVDSFPHFKWFIHIFSNWSICLFYIIAELWPNAVFSLLFWQFVNSITNVEQSKRFYILLGLFGQTGLYISGKILNNLPNIGLFILELFNIPFSKTSLDTVSVQFIITIVVTLGIAAIAIFYLLNHKILDVSDVSKVTIKIKNKKLPLSDSLKMVIQSRYIRLITILLVSYGIAINMVESPWKEKVRQTYPNPVDYAAFVGSYLSDTGIFTILFVLLGSNIIRRIGWFYAAIITPVMVFVTGIGFFMIANFPDASSTFYGHFLVIDPLMLAVTFGAMQNVLSKSSKYTLFDSTKEMAYVPLDDELKTKGKAAADVIGVKLGKSLSSLLQSVIFVLFPTVTYGSMSFLLMVLFTIICIIWFWGVIELNKEYNQLLKKHKVT